MKLVAVVQARLGSTRLPNKVLKDIEGHPMLWQVLRRANAVDQLDDIICAIPSETADDPLCEAIGKWGYRVSRGSGLDVLGRVWAAVRDTRADVVIRLTGDCPCLDPTLIEQTLKLFLDSGADYAANCPTRISGYPDGLDVEVISREALGEAVDEAVYPEDREHVTRFIIRSAPFWKREILGWNLPRCVPKLSVDTQADLDRVRRMHRDLGPAVFGFKELMEYFGDHAQR